MNIEFLGNIGKRWEQTGIAEQLGAHQRGNAPAALAALHQQIALRDAHFQRMAISLRQWLIEHIAREVQSIVRPAERDVVNRYEF